MTLLNSFIDRLHEKTKKRSELVLYVADKLCIERESANRRLNGKVPFTVDEIEKLSRELSISLDSLIQNKDESFLATLKMKIPMSGYSIDDMIINIESQAERLENMCAESIELGTAFSYIPINFILPYSILEKFIFFKWGYFHVGDDEYDDFSSWVIPERLKKANRQLMKINAEIKKRMYIWNPVSIWSMVREIKYFKSIHAINENDINQIKEEMHNMLNDIEDEAKMRKTKSDYNIEMYVSFVNHGLNFYYFKTENSFYIVSDGYFVSMEHNDNSVTFSNLQEWIKSMKKVSTLISESGALERRLFFEEQHNYVNDI